MGQNTHDPLPPCCTLFPSVLTGSRVEKVPGQPSQSLLWARSRGIQHMPSVAGPKVGIVSLQWLFTHMHINWMKHAWISARVSPLFFLATIQALWSVVQCLTIFASDSEMTNLHCKISFSIWKSALSSVLISAVKHPRVQCMHNAPLNCTAVALAVVLYLEILGGGQSGYSNFFWKHLLTGKTCDF